MVHHPITPHTIIGDLCSTAAPLHACSHRASMILESRCEQHVKVALSASKTSIMVSQADFDFRIRFELSWMGQLACIKTWCVLPLGLVFALCLHQA